MKLEQRVSSVLVWLRYGVFLVMLAWTLDKILNTKHAAGVFDKFYGLSGLDQTVFYVIATAELLLIIAFVLGLFKTWTYGAVLVFHGISTLSTFENYIPYVGDPVNLVFFAAWPMLAGCYVLFVLRDLDTRWTLGHSSADPRITRRKGN